MNSPTLLKAFALTLLVTSLPLSARTPVRVALQYEDTLRVVIAAHEATSLCINAGGDGLPMMELVASALDTSRLAKVSVQFPRDGYDDWGGRQIIDKWGKDSLPHVLVFCVGDKFVDNYGHAVASYFDWAGEMGIGIVIVGPRGLKQTFKGGEYFPFFSKEIYNQTTFDDAPLFDGRWLNQPGDSIIIRIRPEQLLPQTRNYYPNINGILRNTYEHVLPVVTPQSRASIAFDDFGGEGRCKVHTVSHDISLKPHYRTVAYQQGYNAAPDTVLVRKLDEKGEWARDSAGMRLYDSTFVGKGYVGGDKSYHGVTIFQDTITYRTYDDRGIARDTIKNAPPRIRRVVMLNFNPGYLKSRVVAEQIVYDAVMYASATHMIGRTQQQSTPPAIGPISSTRFFGSRTALGSSKYNGKPAAIISLDGKKMFLDATHSVEQISKTLPNGLYIVLDDRGNKLRTLSLVR